MSELVPFEQALIKELPDGKSLITRENAIQCYVPLPLLRNEGSWRFYAPFNDSRSNVLKPKQVWDTTHWLFYPSLELAQKQNNHRALCRIAVWGHVHQTETGIWATQAYPLEACVYDTNVERGRIISEEVANDYGIDTTYAKDPAYMRLDIRYRRSADLGELYMMGMFGLPFALMITLSSVFSIPMVFIILMAMLAGGGTFFAMHKTSLARPAKIKRIEPTSTNKVLPELPVNVESKTYDQLLNLYRLIDGLPFGQEIYRSDLKRLETDYVTIVTALNQLEQSGVSLADAQSDDLRSSWEQLLARKKELEDTFSKLREQYLLLHTRKALEAYSPDNTPQALNNLEEINRVISRSNQLPHPD